MQPDRVSEARLPPRRIAAILIVFASVLAFLPVLDADFVNWDDDHNFTTNPHYRGLSLEHLTWMFTTFHYGGYHPLSWLSVAVDHAFWGMDARGYHLTNLVLHAVDSLLVFVLLVEMFALARGARTTAHVYAACGATLLFAVHPLRVETVAWITERRALLASFFLFLTILLYVRSRDINSKRPRTLFWLAVLTYLLSLLSKGMAITLPLILVVLDIFPLRRTVSFKNLLVDKIPFVALAAGVGILARMAQQEGAAVRSFVEHPLLDRCVQAAFGFTFYIWKTVAPTGLCALHPLEERIDWTATAFLGATAVVLIVTVLVWLSRRRNPALLTAWVVYLLVLAPVSGLGQSGPQLVAERYSYLASIPLAALLAGALLWTRHRPRIVLATVLAVGIVTVLLSVKSFFQSRDWLNSTSLWTRVTAVHPKSIQGRFNLAAALRIQGDHRQAAVEFRRCAQLKPVHGSAWHNAGLNFLRSSDHASAYEPLKKALDLHGADDSYWEQRPDIAEILYCVGVARFGTTQDVEAETFLRRAIASNARFLASYHVLADCLVRQHKPADAIKALQNGLAVAPNDVVMQRKLAELKNR